MYKRHEDDIDSSTGITFQLGQDLFGIESESPEKPNVAVTDEYFFIKTINKCLQSR